MFIIEKLVSLNKRFHQKHDSNQCAVFSWGQISNLNASLANNHDTLSFVLLNWGNVSGPHIKDGYRNTLNTKALKSLSKMKTYACYKPTHIDQHGCQPHGKTMSTERRSKIEYYYISNNSIGKKSPDGLIFYHSLCWSTHFWKS